MTTSPVPPTRPEPPSQPSQTAGGIAASNVIQGGGELRGSDVMDVAVISGATFTNKSITY
jgi:hypothetical protein